MEYPVMEAFYTLQGEGYWTGTPAWFIRLAGCDVGCHWCDVKESWDASQHPSRSVASLLAEVAETPARHIVITGGEPTLHNLAPLTRSLRQAGYQLHLETSGAHPLTGEWDWICFSPKKFKPPLPAYYSACHELKVVVYHPSDLQWAETHLQALNPEAARFLQPEWDRKESTTWILDYLKAHPNWRLSLQTHKFIHIP